jgi:glycosyltransferase involved in cell wall biosynthesis
MTMPQLEIAAGNLVVASPTGQRVSVVIPTYQRERVLVETIDHLLELQSGPAEILVVDQTVEHKADTEFRLSELDRTAKIRWLRLSRPSITHAMNVGLLEARNEIVLFLDDDIIPGVDLISAHSSAHATQGCNVVAGQVLQPGEEPLDDEPAMGRFKFRSSRRQDVSELMGGNFSINRRLALGLGGFDENFVRVAYRFEAEFATRAVTAGERILFEPAASIRHLKAGTGGTRSYGEHLTTIKPSHSVGEYYYLLRSKGISSRVWKIVSRPLKAIRTRYHMSHPWWIPGTLIAETLGFFWAIMLAIRGPRLINSPHGTGDAN